MNQAPYQVPMYGPPKPKARSTNAWGIKRCLGCLAVTALAFMCSLSLLCGGTLLLYSADPPPAVNILILGNDSRPGSGEEHIARTDSIMIVSIDPPNKRISILSIPRDLVISTPNFGNLSVNAIIRNAELNQAGSGTTEMLGAISRSFGVEIDYTVRLSFEGFVDLVDAVGGVEIEVPKYISDSQYPTHDGGVMFIEFQPGVQTMDGEIALIYSRTRHADDDYQRAGRQQQVLNAVIKKLVNPLNIRYWPGVWRAFETNTETTIGFGNALQLAPALLLYGRNTDKIERLVIDRETIVYDGSVAMPDMNKLRPWIESHLVH